MHNKNCRTCKILIDGTLKEIDFMSLKVGDHFLLFEENGDKMGSDELLYNVADFPPCIMQDGVMGIMASPVTKEKEKTMSPQDCTLQKLDPKSTLARVKEFHETYGLPVKDSPDISDEKTNSLRHNLLEEELVELWGALEDGDPVEVLDALIDLQYVLDGAFLSFGMAHLKEAAFDEVHRSNMSKLGEDGKPIVRADGKILKGPNYWKPDLSKFVELIKGDL